MNSEKIKRIIGLILDKRFVLSLFIAIALITGIKQYTRGHYNNYKIFKYTFLHSLDEKSLYEEYPLEYGDSNHYGPLFALVIAPFALLPDATGTSLWNIANALILYLGFYSLPLPLRTRSIIALLCAHEALGAMLSFQFNVGLTGLIMLSFSYLHNGKEVKSAFAIALGTLIKLYGIVGLAFFFFSKNKLKFIVSGLIALTVLIILPALLSSPEFIVRSYTDWFMSLNEKNMQNVSLTSMQDISFMGIVRRLMQDATIPNLPFLIGGLFLFFLPYARISQYPNTNFRLMLLASVLIFTVIFSSGSESPTYIIAFAGVSIWFMIQPNPKSKWIILIFIFAFLLTSMSPSDLFPRIIRDTYIKPYSLKALPCVLIWFIIIYQMLTVDFKKINTHA
ncbi:MAG: glycosyltransferase family 87 protein [Daejeonella sp.]|uniref:glycosyltransferase family 87 protein n=1 Tax=Daejeonella sp. TaxID=2805397 RepID=UPI002733D477|nr:glycosyltransferase family 87 protein [Daejeonella sp.]MDP3467629.1 glycosyltransferase family 87 protein [Daejeonella sp.]